MELPHKTKSNKYCSVYGCKSHARKHEGVHFHQFPKKNVSQVKILNHFNQEELIDRQDAWARVLRMGKKISPFMVVCSLHFTQADYIPSLGQKIFLKKTAIPSVNLPKTSVQCFNKSDVSSVLRNERQKRRLSLKNNITDDAQPKKIQESINLTHKENFEHDNDSNDQIIQENEEPTIRKEEDELNLNDNQLSAMKLMVQNFECCIHSNIKEAALNLKKVGINISDEIIIPRLSSVISFDSHENHSCDALHGDHSYSSFNEVKKIEEKSTLIKVFNKFETCAKLNIQVALKKFNDVGTQVNTEFFIQKFSDFISSNAELSTLTGIPNFELLKNINKMVLKVMPLITHSNTKLDTVDIILMTFMKLKQNMSYAALAVLFKSYSATTCRRRVLLMIDVLYVCLKSAICWPCKDEILKNIPLDFVGFENVRAVIDCTEIFIQRPKKLCCQIVTYSRYKSNYTAKFMTAVTPGGNISFISKAYGGRSSDNAIFEQSGIIQKFDKKDHVMADRGFTIDELCKKNDVKLISPPFLKNRKQFSKLEAMNGRKIAQARVHIERCNQRIKTFEILSSKMSIGLVSKIEQIFTIICAIVNLSKPILKNDKFIKV